MAQEAHFKKKLQAFLAEMLKFGTVKGFKYFAMYPRGREELVLSILNQPQSLGFVGTNKADDLAERKRRLCKSESFSSNHLPYDQRSLMLSIRSQMVLSTHGVKDVGLPPASPSEQESMPRDEKSTLFLIAGYGRYNCPYVWVRSNHERLVKLTGDSCNIFEWDEKSTLFLIAGYGRYNCPYVWVRSNHERLVKLTGDSSSEKDCPLKLKTTLKWKDNEVFVWDIIAELVKLCTYPAPRNPFEIDFEYFTMLPLADRVLATGAMVNILQKILIHSPDQKQYAGPVFEELQMITKEHFKSLEELVQSQSLPILQQHRDQKSGSNRYASNRARTSSYNHPTNSYTGQQSSSSSSQSAAYGQYGYNNVAQPLF